MPLTGLSDTLAVEKSGGTRGKDEGDDPDASTSDTPLP